MATPGSFEATVLRGTISGEQSSSLPPPPPPPNRLSLFTGSRGTSVRSAHFRRSRYLKCQDIYSAYVW